MDSSEFVNVCRKIRVLNNIRERSIGLLITSKQYDSLTPSVFYYFL